MGTPSPSSTPRTSSGASCNGSTPRTARPANCPLRCARKASCTFIPTASAFSVASAKTPRRTATAANPQRDAQKLTSGDSDEAWPSIARDAQLLVHTENNDGATALVLMDFIHDETMRLSVNELEFDKAYREPVALLRLQVGAQDKPPVAAKVSLKRKGGKFFVPVGSLYRFSGSRMHF